MQQSIALTDRINIKSRLRVGLILPYNPMQERSGMQNIACRWGRLFRRSGMEAVILTLGDSGKRSGAAIMGHTGLLDLTKTLVSCRWDIVHWMEVWPTSTAVYWQHILSWFLRLRGKVVVLSTGTPGNLKRRGGGRMSMGLVRSAYDLFTVPNNHFMEEYLSCGLPKSRISLVSQGLDPEGPYKPVTRSEVKALKRYLGVPSNNLLIAYVGRLVRRKRPLFLLDILQQVLYSMNNVNAIVVGESWHHEDSLDLQFHNEMGKRRVPRLSWHRQTDIPWKYFQAADILVLPSSNDGEANVVLEAMACRTAVVASNIPSMRAIIADGKTGILCPIEDLNSFVDGIRLLVSDTAVRERIANAASEVIWHERNLMSITLRLKELYIRTFLKKQGRRLGERM